MTVVNPKSISGITSITTASGSDDLLTIHTNNGTERLRVDSTGATKIVTGIVTTLTATTGIVTTLTANTTTLLSDVSFTGASYNMTWDKSDNSLIVNDNARVKFGTGKDLHIYHNESNSVIREEGTGNLNLQTTGGNVEILVATTETAAKFISDGAVELYHNDTKKFETSSSGVTISGGLTASGSSTFNEDVFFAGASSKTITFDQSEGHIRYLDNAKAQFGTQGDLSIYHDGSHSYIADSGTGNLRVLTNSFTVNNTANSANLAQFTEGGSVELFHNGTKQCETSTNGLAFPSGKGIDFSATSDGGTGSVDELLDDYEEGTFAPAFKAANASNNSSTTVQEARYIKVGSLVFFTFYIDMNAHGDNTGGMAYIENLPFTSAGRHTSVSIGYFNSLVQNQTIFTGTVQPSSNNILLRHATGAASGLAGMDYSNAIGTSTEMIVSATYSVV